MAESAKIQFSWKRRPSEIKGFERAMYTTLDNGDYIRVDYNIVDSMARVYVEVNGDKAASYYAIINNGRITLERNHAGRSAKVAEVISARSSQFSTIPNKEILKIINRNYGILDRDAKPVAEKKTGLITREQVRQRYFRQDSNPYDGSEARQTGIRTVSAGISFIDLIDFMFGILLVACTFIIFNKSVPAAGAMAVFWGLVLGFLDIMIRGRDPVFLKIIIFLFGGAFIYIYGYFYY
ncbi:MAG TPA: hypothetical protein PK514_08415 [Spirochaetota bacterium]|nr:hypothetical protein [Spirochaetota bacterium]